MREEDCDARQSLCPSSRWSSPGAGDQRAAVATRSCHRDVDRVDIRFALAAGLSAAVQSIGIVINTIEANMRTEDLLKQSQSLAQQLQSRQVELQRTNEELQEKARLLAHQNQEVERKNAEVEQARQALEEKAKQLALTSKYKSEFLANMSHEIRYV